MIVRKWILSAGLALALVSALQGASVRAPARERAPRALDLRLVKERAICPMEEVVDHDPARYPPRIKLLKCARRPLARCLAGNVPRAHCCDWRAGDLVGDCVEILDYVAVQYRTEAGELSAAQPYAVSVGCACMAAPSTEALVD